MTTTVSNPTESRAVGDARVPFVVGGTLAVVTLFGLAAHAPVQFKKPGLSLIILGVAAGWGLARWAGANKLRSPKFAFAFAAVIIAASAVFATLESHRVSVAPALAAWKQQVAAKDPLAEMFESAVSPSDEETSPEEQQSQRAMQGELEKSRQLRAAKLESERQKLSFSAYLEHRIPEAWGRWQAPLPTLFWLGEVFVCSLLGGFVAGRCTRQT